MIKFFRNIRHEMVKDNRAAKYLFYAMGEIILVVIGILIALQINNWNENEFEKNIEKDYMQNILEDLQQDLKLYKNFTKGNEIIYKLTDSIFETLAPDVTGKNLSDLSFWSRSITMEWVIIDPQTRTYEEMKSSGHLRLIRNKAVSNAISSYYSSLSRFDGYREAAMLWAEDYVSSIGKVFDAKLLRLIMLTRKKQDTEGLTLLTNDLEVHNELLNSLQYFNGALVLGEEVSKEQAKQAEELIHLISEIYNMK